MQQTISMDDPQITDLHILVRRLVTLAAVASRRAQDSYRETPAAGKRITSHLTSAQCHVKRYPSKQEVVFTGSNALLDWIFNFLPIPVRYGKGWVHWGFALAHKSLWSRVLAELDPGKPVVFIGHSAGGALADLSCDFTDHFESSGFIAFGKPNLRRKLNHKDDYHSLDHLSIKLSVVNYGDVVATIPRVLFGPHPEQDILYRDRNSETHLNCTADYRRRDRKVGHAVKGHFMYRYVMWLERLSRVTVWATELPSAAANDPDVLEKSA